jgi:hypothetical protein
MTAQQSEAVVAVAKAFGWTDMETDDLGIMLWALFRYYAGRLRRPPIDFPPAA